MNIHYLIQHISYELHTIVKTWTGELTPHTVVDSFCARKDLNGEYLPFIDFVEFFNKAKSTFPISRCPLIFSTGSKEQPLIYGCVLAEEMYFLVGPIRLSSNINLNSHIECSLPDKQDLSSIFTCSFYFLCSQLLLAYNLFQQDFVTNYDLIYANCTELFQDSEIVKNYSSLIFERHEQEEPHNPYEQEVREFMSIELGDVQMLKNSIAEDYSGKLGILSKDEVRNVKNLGIVLTTLASRAAIRGGLLPEIAFSMSDVFIQKMEEMTDPFAIYAFIRQMEFQYAQAVAEIKAKKTDQNQKTVNMWIEKCKDYIFKHLHEKIRIQDIAEHLHLNANYLSELFKRHECMTLTDFILREKIKLTKNLLSYSPYSYSEIAAYLGFSSQSHLGKVFKKYTQMTMRQYREKYGQDSFAHKGSISSSFLDDHSLCPQFSKHRPWY